MTEQGYITLPRAPHTSTSSFHPSTTFQPPTTAPQPPSTSHYSVPSAPLSKYHSAGGLGGSTGSQGNVSTSGRSIHDGFATIRTGSSKRGRARSSPNVVSEARTHTCQHGCCTPPGWPMEPLWEEKGGNVEATGTQTVAKRERPQLPWWEVATRRSRYRSCPAFSQANIVTALEQTVNNVTDKLEKLASSPDLKAIEAAELRKTAATLRQQSTAVCQSVSSGYFSMERQLSCDSVSSVTSTISAASMTSYASLGPRKLSAGHLPFPQRPSHTLPHPEMSSEQAKIKKRSWLRSSFRRAFGRHGRKRSKQGVDGGRVDGGRVDAGMVDAPVHELPVHHAVNGAVRNLSPPPPPYESVVARQNGSLRKQYKAKQQISSGEDESEVVLGLRQELADKDRALTDCRLEVLSAQHQLTAQADTVAKLQNEVTSLRDENTRLAALVRVQYGPAAEALLTPLASTLTALTLSRSSVTTGSSVSPREEGRRVKVVVAEQRGVVAVKDVAKAAPGSSSHIGTVTIESKTTWEELDSMVAFTVKDYGNRIDPVSALGLDGDSVLCYRMDDVVYAPGLPRPPLLPYGYCVGDVDSLVLWLKGAGQRREGEALGSVCDSAFASATPASSLRQLGGVLVEHRRLVLAGPPSSGKTHLALALARLYVVNSGRELTEDAIKTFTVTGSNSLELCQVLTSVWPRGAGHTTDAIAPVVIVIDDLHAAGGVVETLQRCLPASVHSGPAVIATSCATAALATRLHIHCNFRWAALSPQQEPVRGLLGRVLRRRVVQAEVAANTRQPDALHLAEWLTRLWLHLNTLLSGYCGSNEAGVGPGMLIDCPTGQEESQGWFTEVWNTRVVPHVITTVKASSTLNPGLVDTWTDPLDWVLATYPWHGNAACGPDQLIRIGASDVSAEAPAKSLLAPVRPQPPSHQNTRVESIYATPHLTQATVHATDLPKKIISKSQSILSQVPEHKADPFTTQPDLYKPVVPQVIEPKTDPFIDEGVNMHYYSRTRSNSNASSCKLETFSKRSSGSIDEILTLKSSNSCETLDSHVENIYPSLRVYPRPRYQVDRNSCEVMSSAGSSRGSTSDEAMESDGSVKDAESTKGRAVSMDKIHCIKSCHGDQESDGKKMFSNKPQPLDVLAKNAINTCGLSPDCVKIMKERSSKIHLKDISKELTTTFKPVETAM